MSVCSFITSFWVRIWTRIMAKMSRIIPIEVAMTTFRIAFLAGALRAALC